MSEIAPDAVLKMQIKVTKYIYSFLVEVKSNSCDSDILGKVSIGFIFSMFSYFYTIPQRNLYKIEREKRYKNKTR